MIEITLESARQALRSVVAEFGEEYIYTEKEEAPSHILPNSKAGGSCFYVEDSEEGSIPSCIVAQVLHKHFGWSIDDLKEIEGTSANDIPGVERDASMYLWHAQSAQDSGDTWGEALRVAERSL